MQLIIYAFLTLAVGVQENPFSHPTDIKLREWTDTTGMFKVDAVLLKVEGKEAHLKRQDEKVVVVPIAKLSDADREYCREFAKSVQDKLKAEGMVSERLKAIETLEKQLRGFFSDSMEVDSNPLTSVQKVTKATELATALEQSLGGLKVMCRVVDVTAVATDQKTLQVEVAWLLPSSLRWSNIMEVPRNATIESLKLGQIVELHGRIFLSSNQVKDIRRAGYPVVTLQLELPNRLPQFVNEMARNRWWFFRDGNQEIGARFYVSDLVVIDADHTSEIEKVLSELSLKAEAPPQPARIPLKLTPR